MTLFIILIGLGMAIAGRLTADLVNLLLGALGFFVTGNVIADAAYKFGKNYDKRD